MLDFNVGGFELKCSTKKITGIMLFLLCTVNTFAASGAELAKKLNLNAGDKASRQWERVFSSSDKLKEIGAAGLSDGEKSALKAYLIDHAADSDKPAAAGK